MPAQLTSPRSPLPTSPSARAAGPADVFLCHAPIGHAFGNGDTISFPCVPARGRSTSKRRHRKRCGRPSRSTGSPCSRAPRRGTERCCAPRRRGRRGAAFGPGLGRGARPAHRRGLAPRGGRAPAQRRRHVPDAPHLFLESGRDGVVVAPGLSVGSPLPGYEARLVDPDGEPVTGSGETGPLAVRGPSGITYWTTGSRRRRPGPDRATGPRPACPSAVARRCPTCPTRSASGHLRRPPRSLFTLQGSATNSRLRGHPGHAVPGMPSTDMTPRTAATVLRARTEVRRPNCRGRRR